MKNLLFVFVLSIFLMSFTTTKEEVKDIDFINSVQTEKLLDEPECWSRKCIVFEGESYCTDWVQTDCSEWE